LVIEIDNLRFIERDATAGCHEMALMDNFPLPRHPSGIGDIRPSTRAPVEHPSYFRTIWT
jgi:hypothetical protein